MPFKAEEDQEEEERMEVDIWEERKLVLALRRLQSIRLLAALLEKAQVRRPLFPLGPLTINIAL